MENIEEVLKESSHYLYLVRRFHDFVYIPNSKFEPHVKIDVGQYSVSELICSDVYDYDKIVNNFSSILTDDENALLTRDYARAQQYACLMNRKINETIEEDFDELMRDSESEYQKIYKRSFEFEQAVLEDLSRKF